MKFNSPKEILEFIQDGNDLYSKSAKLYVFVYNNAGAICIYDINITRAKKLSLEAKLYDEYWSAFLGIGGTIYDCPDNINKCCDLCDITDWELTVDVFKEA